MSSTSTNPNPNPNPNPQVCAFFFKLPEAVQQFIFACIVFIFLTVIVSIVSAIIFGGIPYAIYSIIIFIDPPTMSPAVTLNSLSVSSFNLTADSLSADFDIALAIDNPNRKVSFYYDRLVATVYLGQAIDDSNSNCKTCCSCIANVYLDLNRLAAAPLPPLFLPENTSTTLNARMAAVSEIIGEDTANSIRSGFQKGDANVKFNLLVGAVERSSPYIYRVGFDVNIAFKNASGAMNNGPIRKEF